jgi:hypothetical protein
VHSDSLSAYEVDAHPFRSVNRTTLLVSERLEELLKSDELGLRQRGRRRIDRSARAATSL